MSSIKLPFLLLLLSIKKSIFINFFINEYDRIGLLLNDLIKKSFIDYYGKEYEEID